MEDLPVLEFVPHPERERIFRVFDVDFDVFAWIGLHVIVVDVHCNNRLGPVNHLAVASLNDLVNKPVVNCVE